MHDPDPTTPPALTGDGVHQQGDSRLSPEGRAALWALVEDDKLGELLDADGYAMSDMGVHL